MTIEQVLSSNGPLSKLLPGFVPREQQLRVAEEVQTAFRQGKISIIEAGTGTGKTISYLLPAIQEAQRGKRVLICTNTVHLQSQLYDDMQVCLKAMNAGGIRVSKMKGRSNYLCHVEMDNADVFIDELEGWDDFRDWSLDSTNGGDLQTYSGPFKTPRMFNSDSHSCLGHKCEHIARCGYFIQRMEAKESHIIITNHSMFLADLKIRMIDPERAILPDYDHVIFDEGHQLFDKARDAFTEEFRSEEIYKVLSKLRKSTTVTIDHGILDMMESETDELTACLYAVPGDESVLMKSVECSSQRDKLNPLVELLVKNIDRLYSLVLDPNNQNIKTKKNETEYEVLCKNLESLQRTAATSIHAMQNWQECSGLVIVQRYTTNKTQRTAFVVKIVPKTMAGILSGCLWEPGEERGCGFVLISATMGVNGDFTSQKTKLGIQSANQCDLPSPFNYAEQACLWIADIPKPPASFDTHHCARVAGIMVDIINQVDGDTFLLFTSNRMLNEVYYRIRGKVPNRIYKQGDKPSSELLADYKSNPHSVLMGCYTFWEGVDVPGDRLRCVVIDRLPFKSPNDIVDRAYEEVLKRKGVNVFTQHALPEMVIKLKQGAGRLIRTINDHGLICILDSRINESHWGPLVARALPAFASIDSLAQCQAYV